MGTHIGPATAHTTHRALDLSFRMLVALLGHAGIEWDITTCTADELDGADRAGPRSTASCGRCCTPATSCAPRAPTARCW